MSPERQEDYDFLSALGGRHGIADSSVPALAFIAAYAASGGELEVALWVAVGVAALLTVARVVRRETLQFALAGFAGVAIAAFIAQRTGRAEDFFLPGLLANLGYAATYAISIAVRWPLLGVIVGLLSGEGMGWRKDPERVRVYARASWIWVGIFCFRLAVQLPLYLAGWVVALGVARAAMGIPIFALGLWLSYLVLRAGGELTREPAR
ncbi:MAG: DUF3159 domain-containing protein [Solirubrobacterales bacterium]